MVLVFRIVEMIHKQRPSVSKQKLRELITEKTQALSTFGVDDELVATQLVAADLSILRDVRNKFGLRWLGKYIFEINNEIKRGKRGFF